MTSSIHTLCAVAVIACLMGCGEKRTTNGSPGSGASQASKAPVAAGARAIDPATAHLPHVVSLTGSMHLVEDEAPVAVNDAVGADRFIETDDSGHAVIQWPEGLRVEVEPLSRIAVADASRPVLLLASGAIHVIDNGAGPAEKRVEVATTRATFRSIAASEQFVQTTADGSVVTATMLSGEARVASNAGATECDLGDTRVHAGQAIVLDAEHLDGNVSTLPSAPTLAALRAALPHVPSVCEATGLATFLPSTFASRFEPALISAERQMLLYPDIAGQRDLLRRQGDSERVRTQIAQLGEIDTRIAACQGKLQALWYRASAYRGCRLLEWRQHFTVWEPRVQAVLRFRLEGTHG